MQPRWADHREKSVLRRLSQERPSRHQALNRYTTKPPGQSGRIIPTTVGNYPLPIPQKFPLTLKTRKPNSYDQEKVANLLSEER